MPLEIEITVDDLSDGNVIKLLRDHRQEMLQHSPADSVHALDIDAINEASLTFLSAKTNHSVVGCVALQRLDEAHAEIKSMKVSGSFVGRGIGRALLDFVLGEANRCGYKQVSLETGTMDVFIPARALYQSVGFRVCPPFNGYVEDIYSVCMTLDIK